MTNFGYQFTKAFDDLEEPAAVFIGYRNLDPIHNNENQIIDKLVKRFNELKIKAARFDTPQAEDPSVLIVTPTGIQSPMIAPEDTKDAALLYGSVINSIDETEVKGFPNSVVCSQLTAPIEEYADEIRGYKMSPHAHPSPKVIDEILERRGEDFESRMVAKFATLEKVSPDDPELLYSGKEFPQQHLITRQTENRAVVYATPEIKIAQEYPALNPSNPHAYTFVQSYYKAEKQLKFMDFGWEDGRPPVLDDNQWYESVVWPHKNKQGPVLLHKLDEHGNHVFYKIPENDPEWQDFLELQRPAYTENNPHLLKRRQNLLRQVAEGNLQVHDFMGEKRIPNHDNIKHNSNQMSATSKSEKADDLFSIMAKKRGLTPNAMRKLAAASHKRNAVNKRNILSAASGVNTQLDQLIDKTITQGTKTLNNTAVGKAYGKATDKLADNRIVKTIEKATGNVGKKIAASAVGKTVSKTVTKVVGSALGKSIIKKIPLISLGAGCYFAWDRVKSGDWKGACGEIASGALSCFPGVGTAASTAIDLGLAVKDVKEVWSAPQDRKATENKTQSIESCSDEEYKILPNTAQTINAIQTARGIRPESGKPKTETNSPSRLSEKTNQTLQLRINDSSR